MTKIAQWLGRAGAGLGLGICGVYLVLGVVDKITSIVQWAFALLYIGILAGIALLAGWAARRAPDRPARAGLLLWLAALVYGFIWLGVAASPRHQPREWVISLLLPPAAFFLAGFAAFIGSFTSARPPRDAA